MRHLQINQWRYLLYVMAILAMVLIISGAVKANYTMVGFGAFLMVLCMLRFWLD